MVGFLSRKKHLWWLLLYPLVGLGFSFCEALVPQVVNQMEWQPFDGWVPFVPAMVWPYVFWYALIAFALVWTGWTDADGFRRLVAFLYLGMTTAYVVYLLFPNGQRLRPSLSSLGVGADFDLLRWIYTHDTPTNCNPSIHVIDTMAVWFALARDKILSRRLWLAPILAAVCLAIIASTVMIKQHSVVDILGGLAWSLWLWVLLYRSGGFSFRFPEK